jgi:hypothetical protein
VLKKDASGVSPGVTFNSTNMHTSNSLAKLEAVTGHFFLAGILLQSNYRIMNPASTQCACLSVKTLVYIGTFAKNGLTLINTNPEATTATVLAHHNIRAYGILTSATAVMVMPMDKINVNQRLVHHK